MKQAKIAVALVLSMAAGAVAAHDSWFARLGALAGDEPLLALGTGNRFPVFEFAIGREYLVRQACRWPDGQTRPLQPVRMTGNSLILRPGQPGVTGCWAQLQAFDVDVAADKVDLYLDEINATPELRRTWAAMHARGVAWKERYTKHARIELLAAPAESSGSSGSSGWADMAVDIRRVSGAEPGRTRVGDPLVYEVRRNGQPLAGLQLELRHVSDPAVATGGWHATDARGRVQVQPTAAGAWLLRGVDLRVSPTQPDRWESDFLTLAFNVMPKAD